SFLGMMAQPEIQGDMRVDIQLWGEALRSQNVRALFERASEMVLRHLREIVETAQARGEIAPELDASAVARVLTAIYYGMELQKAMEPEFDVAKSAQVVRSLYSGAFWRGAPPAGVV
ncbi:MAG: TetR family transcriptional regulator C-terminal domain-containing protein, partial [Chloroflexi bacterium]|nr:TetR family transcriptional regulator C-terminal domain-containing protein [Chloroflexota bacterium]